MRAPCQLAPWALLLRTGLLKARPPRGEARPQQGWGTLRGSAPTTSNPARAPAKPSEGLARRIWGCSGARLSRVGALRVEGPAGEAALGWKTLWLCKILQQIPIYSGSECDLQAAGRWWCFWGSRQGFVPRCGPGHGTGAPWHQPPAAPGPFFVAAKPGEADANLPKKKKPASRVSAVLSPN